MEEMEKNARKLLRNTKIANIVLNESYFFKRLIGEGMLKSPARVSYIGIDYEKIMTMSEYIESHPEINYGGQGSPSFDKMYSIPVTITYADGATQKIDAFFDDYANNVATVAYDLNGNKPDFSTFMMSRRYQEQCTHFANKLLQKGFSKTTVQIIMKLAASESFVDMLQTMENQNRVIVFNEKALEMLAQKYEEFSTKEGMTPEELNKVKLEDLMIADEEQEEYNQKTESDKQPLEEEEGKEEKEDKEVPTVPEPVEEEPVEEQKQEDEKEKEAQKSLANGVSVDKISNALRAADLHASQVQDIIFIPHPRELNQYLPGEYKINNDQEVVLIKLRSTLREPSRYEILQGEGPSIQRIETRSRYNEVLNEIFPEKSTIGANAYKINEKEDKEVEMSLTCDGKAQRINLSEIPISQRVDLEKQLEIQAKLEEIQARTDMEIKSAEAITDPVDREKALAKAHEDSNKALIDAQIPGTDEEPIIDENTREIIEHLKAADEAEKAKAELEEAKEEEEVNPEAKAMLGLGAAAVGVAAATELSNADMENLLADIGAPTIADGHDDHSEGRGPRIKYDQ